MSVPTDPRSKVIHEPINTAQAYLNGVICELEANYNAYPECRQRLEGIVLMLDAFQHDFEDRMISEEVG